MEAAGGRAIMTTVGGGNLTFSREGDAIYVADASGGRARIGQSDQIQSNGVIHHIDAVLMPAAGPAE